MNIIINMKFDVIQKIRVTEFRTKKFDPRNHRIKILIRQIGSVLRLYGT